MFKPLAIRPEIHCQMTKHCQFLSQANAYNFFIVLKSSKKFVQKSTTFVVVHPVVQDFGTVSENNHYL